MEVNKKKKKNAFPSNEMVKRSTMNGRNRRIIKIE